MAPSRDDLTPLRRGIGGMLVVLLLAGAILYYYRTTTSPSVAASSLSRSSDPSPSLTAGPEPLPATATPTASDNATPSPQPKTIVVYVDESISAKPFETVRIRGTYHGGADTFVQAERRDGAKWVAFPLTAKTDQLGRFIIHVELGESGPHWLRVVDPAARVMSKDFVLAIKG